MTTKAISRMTTKSRVSFKTADQQEATLKKFVQSPQESIRIADHQVPYLKNFLSGVQVAMTTVAHPAAMHRRRNFWLTRCGQRRGLSCSAHCGQLHTRKYRRRAPSGKRRSRGERRRRELMNIQIFILEFCQKNKLLHRLPN